MAPALAAAQAVARRHRVACEQAVVLAAGSNVLVHLRPSPVVARVMTGTVVLHADPERWLAREVDVGRFLAARARPLAVAPSDLVAPGPHEQDGLWMTLWSFVPPAAAPPPQPREIARSLRELHTALAGFEGDLPPLRGIRDWLVDLLGRLRPSPAAGPDDLARLGARLEALTPAVFESRLPAQALHGDASISNLLRSGGALLWNDLEDVCAGPVAWDLAALVTSARGRGHDERFVAELLAGYGDPPCGDFEAFLEAHAVYDAIWRGWRERAAA